MVAAAPDAERGLWAVVGAPAETSDLANPSDLEFAQTVHWLGVDRQHEREGFDYVDLGIPMGAPGRLRSYGGVSGGGLWQIDVLRRPDGTWGWLAPPKLEGCAFYQTAPDHDLVFIRCHGRKSIYEHGLSVLGVFRGEIPER